MSVKHALKVTESAANRLIGTAREFDHDFFSLSAEEEEEVVKEYK